MDDFIRRSVDGVHTAQSILDRLPPAGPPRERLPSQCGGLPLQNMLVLRQFLLRLYGFEHLLQKAGLGYCAHHLDAVVHHRLRDALYPVALDHIDELGEFDHIGGDVLVFDGKLVGQPGRTRAVGAGRGDEDLDVQVLLDRRQDLSGFLAQPGRPLRDIDEAFDQRGELVARRDAEVAHRAPGMALQDKGRNACDAQLLCLLLITHEIFDGQVQLIRGAGHFLQQFARLLAGGAFLARDEERRLELGEVGDAHIILELLCEERLQGLPVFR